MAVMRLGMTLWAAANDGREGRMALTIKVL